MEESSQSYTEVTLPGVEKAISYTQAQITALNRLSCETNFSSAEPLLDKLAFAIGFGQISIHNDLFSSTSSSKPTPFNDYIFESVIFIILTLASIFIAPILLLPFVGWLGYLTLNKMTLIYNAVDNNKALIRTLASHWINNAEHYKEKHNGNTYADDSAKSYEVMGRTLLDFIDDKKTDRSALMHALRQLCFDINKVKQTEINLKKDQRFALLALGYDNDKPTADQN